MAKFDVKALNYITCGSKLNTFNIEYKYTDDGMIESRPSAVISALNKSYTNTFFGDIGTNESMTLSGNTNKASFYDIDNKMIIHGMYCLSKSRLRSTAKNKDVNPTNIDVYMPIISNDMLNICLLQSYAYGLTRETKVNPIHKNVIFNNATKIDKSYYYELSNEDVTTYLYPTVKDLTNDIHISTYLLYALENSDLSNSRISSIFSPSRNLSGINYSYIVEVPLGTLKNEYEKGFIQCDMALTKSIHNFDYNIDISSDDYDVNGCREYINIDSCGDLVYLTYRDNVNYINKHKMVTYYDNVNSEYDLLSVDVAKIDERRLLEISSYSYLHVEVIESIHRFDGSLNEGHKSSLYSIRITDSGLNESTIPEKTKAMLRLNIKNNIKKIADKICPANTQLFDVYFEGQ